MNSSASPTADHRNSKIVFIGGLHRSGTSLFYRCLGDHPKVSVFSDTDVPEDEGQHLQSVYPPAMEHGGPGRFGFDSESFSTEKSALVSEENANALWAHWAPHWDLSKSRLVEKSPPNLVRMRFLQALFPESYFIVLIRHPIAVSYATRKWSETRPDSLIRHWLVCHDRFDHDRAYIKKLLVVRYEDFVLHPDEVLQETFRFLGLEHSPLERNVKQGMNRRYFNAYESLSHRGPIYQAYMKYMQLRFERRTCEFGYSMDPQRYVLDAPEYCLDVPSRS